MKKREMRQTYGGGGWRRRKRKSRDIGVQNWGLKEGTPTENKRTKAQI